MALGQGPGGTVTPSNITQYYDALLSTTLEAFRPTLIDNIFKDSAFLTALKMTDSWVSQDGGVNIRIPLLYGDNSTIKSYEGYDVIDTTPQDGVGTAFYEWREIGGTITISRKEERQNSGEAQLIPLLETKIKQAEMTIREEVNRQLVQGVLSGTTFIPGNTVKDMYPLAYFMPKANATNPASGGNIGNISSAAESWWRAKTAVLDSASLDTGNSFAMAITTYAGLKAALRRMYNYCSRGTGGPPNFALVDQLTYETYENALDVNIRFASTKLGELGFDSVRLRGAEVIWDELVPSVDTGNLTADESGATGTAFFINTNFYKVVYDAQTNFIATPFIEMDQQTVRTSKILFMGNSTCSNLRKLGVAYAISRTITS